ncbi:hypothetical protein B4107_0749 [Bacillus safensis]|nr:hypothetical protein B4107_0749 [Bacillus safensis]
MSAWIEIAMTRLASTLYFVALSMNALITVSAFYTNSSTIQFKIYTYE